MKVSYVAINRERNILVMSGTIKDLSHSIDVTVSDINKVITTKESIDGYVIFEVIPQDKPENIIPLLQLSYSSSENAPHIQSIDELKHSTTLNKKTLVTPKPVTHIGNLLEQLEEDISTTESFKSSPTQKEELDTSYSTNIPTNSPDDSFDNIFDKAILSREKNRKLEINSKHLDNLGTFKTYK